MAANAERAVSAAVEALHSSRCREPGCLARSHETDDTSTVLNAAMPWILADAGHATLTVFARELDNLAGRYGWDNLGPAARESAQAAARKAISDCAALASFLAAQTRDGLLEDDTGISHCAACHGADLDPDGPRCGHTAGCPEC